MKQKKEKEKLEIDESLLTPEQKAESGYHFPWWILILCGVIAILMVVCIIVIRSIPTK